MSEVAQRRFVTPDGLTLVADIAGRSGAPTVVLLHGGGQTRHSWAKAMQRLIDGGYFVINYDARGHGDSDWSPAGDYSLPALSSDLRTVLQGVDAPTALVGASMGGMTGFYAVGSAARPLAAALVLVDIVLRPANAGVEKIRHFMNAHQEGFGNLAEAADAVRAYNPSRITQSNPAGLMKNLRHRDDGRLYWHWDPRIMDITPSAEPPSFTNELERVSSHVTIPTLLIRGGQSDIVDDAGVAEMRRLVPQTEVYEIPAAGHMIAGDSNDAFNDSMLAFLERHLPPPPAYR